jgi:hypothetical protein
MPCAARNPAKRGETFPLASGRSSMSTGTVMQIARAEPCSSRFRAVPRQPARRSSSWSMGQRGRVRTGAFRAAQGAGSAVCARTYVA